MRKPKKVAKSEKEVDSVFLAKHGRDQRIAKRLDKKDAQEDPQRKPKVSRYFAKRPSMAEIPHYKAWGVNPVTAKLQAKFAVKVYSARHPDRVRILKAQCEVMGGSLGKIAVPGKNHLEEGQIDSLVVETGLPEEEIHALLSSFTRYDIDDSGYLDRSEVRQVLCDLGLQPTGCEEKVEVHEIICDADIEGLRHYSFNVFVRMVKAVRERLRQIQLGECMIIFEEADRDGNTVLSVDEVLRLLEKRLHLTLNTPEERAEVMAIFNSCDSDSDGQIDFEEFQEFAQRARAKLMTMRRQEELTIAKAFHLPPEIVNEFRMDLPQLWAIFNRYDRKGQSTVSRTQLVQLLIDAGQCPSTGQQDCEKTAMVNLLIDNCAKEETDFRLFLDIVNEVRQRTKAGSQESLYESFHAYDKYKTGQIQYGEMYAILADFEMLPKSREEQAGIVTVMERLDDDGSGTFDFEEFQDFFQRLTEQVQISERESERQMALAMSYTEVQLQALRSIFHGLHPNLDGKVPQMGMMSAVHRSRDILCPSGALDEQTVRDITRNAQRAPDVLITFQEFAQALQKLVIGKEKEPDSINMADDA
jgi:Ca2+-binding EF-hand superfamily protein